MITATGVANPPAACAFFYHMPIVAPSSIEAAVPATITVRNFRQSIPEKPPIRLNMADVTTAATRKKPPMPSKYWCGLTPAMTRKRRLRVSMSSAIAPATAVACTRRREQPFFVVVLQGSDGGAHLFGKLAHCHISRRNRSVFFIIITPLAYSVIHYVTSQARPYCIIYDYLFSHKVADENALMPMKELAVKN